MSLQACADIVRKGDPDRYRAAMAAPVEARRVLFPLYAFNVEVARAPWVASEPMIGEMRLQWWRDALEEISGGGAVRRHEVTEPLADAIDASVAGELDRLIAARRWDLYNTPFEDVAHFQRYLSDTGGTMTWACARSLGAPEEASSTVQQFGAATALVRFLAAVPDLEARGRVPLVDGRPEAVASLARAALRDLPTGRALRTAVPRSAWPALLEGWQTRPLLKAIARDPSCVAGGRVAQSEFRSRLGLFLASLRL